ncbi:MAG: CRISPR-associated helicase/endonuclease Cas3 [Deltaproteobacteria bacterium]|nr:CRISPR-associated helicase/endonuclease Cas3 [Deltaproteobacteria bacterium]
MNDEMKSYYRYWGKTSTSEDGTISYHLLPYHCLDVAAVVAAWWERSFSIRRSFCNFGNLKDEQMRAWVLFFAALHDYGKFDVRFQLRAKSAWRFLYPNVRKGITLPSEHDCKQYYHGEAGLFWFMQDHGEFLGIDPDRSITGLDFLDEPSEVNSARWSLWKVWLEAVMGHHGHIKAAEYISDANLPPICNTTFSDIDKKARRDWLALLERIFLKPVGISLEDNPPPCSPLMAGFCSIADWLGSRCDEQLFSFLQHPLDLEEYFDKRYRIDATKILEYAGMISHPHSYSGIDVLLPSDNSPRSVQTMVDQLPLKTGLSVVEAPTGSGKTEAALAYAWRIIDAGLADSIVFALPTQATANAMLDRITILAKRLFNDHPNVVLAHGFAKFNKTFADLKHRALKGYEQEDGWIQCAKWLAESRKRIFLGQIGVCTIDQVLISVLPVRHRFVRGFGLGRSILIVDEVHAYDTYMYGLLEEVLRQQKLSGGTAILLSATLSTRQLRQICAAWSVQLDVQEIHMPYPLITWTNGTTTEHFELDPSQHTRQIFVKMEPIRLSRMKPDEALLLRIVHAADAGAHVAIVCNLVDVAQDVVRTLRSMTRLPVDLFHARYCYRHRQEKELSVIECYGSEERGKPGRILVATQVVEQSLDVDFDWLITQLCPLDLLFQRMGRLHRHRRKRPSGFKRPLCTILLPLSYDYYGLHGLIYSNTRVLWRTTEMLLHAPDGQIVFPNAYRTWIEKVYRDSAWGEEPEEVERGYEKFQYEIEELQRYKARYMVDTAMNPCADTDEFVMAVTRDGDMNLAVVPFCLTSQGTMLMDGTILESVNEYDRLECLTLNTVGVPKSWRRFFENNDEGRCWLDMKRDGEGFKGFSKGATFRYHKDTGLEKEK